MPKLPYATVDLDVAPGERHPTPRPESDTPFRILLMGDFSGRANRGAPAPARWRPVLLDEFDDVLADMRPALKLGRSAHPIELEFRDLDDFHPDHIYQHVPQFAHLKKLRNRLEDRSTFAAAAAEVQSWSDEAEPAPAPKAAAAAQPAATAPKPDVSALASGNLLDNVLEATSATAAKAPPPRDALRDFVAKTVAPHLVPRAAANLPQLLARVDEEVASVMRAILHHPDFQALEAAWRALHFILRRMETDVHLKLYLLDISEVELAALANGGSEASALYKVLAKESSEDAPWAVVAGNFTFTRTEEDIELLSSLGSITRLLKAPFLAEADPAGDPDTEEAQRMWDALRTSRIGPWIGLALPRFLARLPYGKKAAAVESFAFEEMPGRPEHGDYLWANPVFACVLLLAKAFSESEWDLQPGQFQDIGGLPLHVYDDDGEPEAKPCAEVLMTEKDAQAILDQGFMPLVSMKHRDSIRLLRFQSIADPLSRISGRWVS